MLDLYQPFYVLWLLYVSPGFNIQKFGMKLCILNGFQTKVQLFPYKILTGFTNEAVCVYCVAKNKPFNIIQVNFNMSRVNTIGPLCAV